MRSVSALFFLALFVSACGAPSHAAPPPKAPPSAGSAVSVASLQLREDLAVRQLAPSVLMHTTWKELPELGRFPSNGLVVLGAREALLVDTAWTEEATIALLDHVERAHRRRVTHLVVTHSHEDRVAGIAEALRRGITVHALRLTAERTVAAGYPAPSVSFERDAVLDFDGIRAEVFFPGAAHAPDNVVVYLPGSGVLAGSCMIRSADASVLGNLADASLATWADAVRAVRARFPALTLVVPGHGEPGDASLLEHTLELVAAGK